MLGAFFIARARSASRVRLVSRRAARAAGTSWPSIRAAISPPDGRVSAFDIEPKFEKFTNFYNTDPSFETLFCGPQCCVSVKSPVFVKCVLRYVRNLPFVLIERYCFFIKKRASKSRSSQRAVYGRVESWCYVAR